MPDTVTHPSHDKLAAYGLGQLPSEQATFIEQHITECKPCCETIFDLSSGDTFVDLLCKAKHAPTDQTVHCDGQVTCQNSVPVPTQLAEHPRYEIVGLIGKGGMGDVYEARHRKMERTVALKIINQELMRKPEAVARFHREVKTAAQLSHPNIVTAYDADQAGDFHFMVMEYVDGIDLSQTVSNRGVLPISEACEYIRQAAIGLQHAHQRGMVHRDIKPHNLMVTGDGTVKILDFGLASLAPEATSDSETEEVRSDLTAVGAIMGTPDFISPEQAEDARQADIRSDIYSLGTTLYFLLTGRPPFADGSIMHKLKSHAHAEPEPLESLRDEIPPDLAAIVSKMIAKDPADRFQTPAEAVAALESFAQARQEAASNPSPSQTDQPRRWKPTFLSLTALGVLFVAALFAGLIYYVQTNHGVVRVEVADPSLEVSIKDHTITMKDGDGKPLTIRPGEQTLIVRKDDADFEFETNSFQIRRGDKIAFKVDYVQGEIVVKKDGEAFSKATSLVGEWRGRYRPKEELRLNLKSNGTFEMSVVDLNTPERPANRTTGKYTTDFSVSPARLDLDGTTIYPAFNPDSVQLIEHGGPPGSGVATGPERETVAKRKVEAIIELIDANTLRLSNIEKDNRPKTFDDEELVMYRQGASKVPGGLVISPELKAEAGFPESGPILTKLQEDLYASLSRAAGIPLEEWEAFAKNPQVPSDLITGMPLSQLLLTTDNASVFENYFVARQWPQMREIHKAMAPSSPHGYVSLIQPEYITKATLGVDEKTKLLRGTVSFESPVSKGSVNFAVDYYAGRMKVVEFSLPKAEIRLARDQQGVWAQSIAGASDLEPSRPDAGDRPDFERIQGTWQVVSGSTGGSELEDDEVDEMQATYTFTNNRLLLKYSITKEGQEVEKTFLLDPTKNPKQIDTTNQDGNTLSGIYEFRGDQLNICWAVRPSLERPAAFETKSGKRTSLLRLKRVSKPESRQPLHYELSKMPKGAREMVGFRPQEIQADSRFASLWKALKSTPLAPVVDHRLAEVISVKLADDDGALMPPVMIMTVAAGSAREFALAELAKDTDLPERINPVIFYPAKQSGQFFQIVDNQTILMAPRAALNTFGMQSVSIRRTPNTELSTIAAGLQDGLLFAVGNYQDKRFLEIVKQQGSKDPIGIVAKSHIPLWQDTSYLTLSVSMDEDPQLRCSAHALSHDQQAVITQSLGTLRFSLANLLQSMTSIGNSPIDKTSAQAVIAALREAKVTELSKTETRLIVSLEGIVEASQELLKLERWSPEE